jgi:hypothetical protein
MEYRMQTRVSHLDSRAPVEAFDQKQPLLFVKLEPFSGVGYMFGIVTFHGRWGPGS